MKFIGSARFLATPLSNLVDNLTEGIHKIKCKDCDCFLEYESAKDNAINSIRSCKISFSSRISMASTFKKDCLITLSVNLVEKSAFLNLFLITFFFFCEISAYSF